ncbi:MAG: response regulator transcription factor [Gorillibacterium sp.]|nr:response regulator transcription factor [Gorillibacterium sp.]
MFTIHKKILIVDDDDSIIKITKLYLTKSGYDVEEAYNGAEALNKINSGHFDLIVLDLMLPIVDGKAVCRQMRENHNLTPIIMLTARAEVDERIEGLRMGADDYLVKPFDPNELLARMESIFRRQDQTLTVSNGDPMNVLSIGNFSLAMDSFTASINATPISLTRREFELLSFLVQHSGKVHTREKLISQIWGWDFDGEDRVVDLYIQRIRHKMGPGSGWSLTTVWGVGYKFEATSC